MPVVNTNTIKEWFRTLKKPTEDQFHTWLDSFRHKWEKVPLDDVEGLTATLQKKADLVDGVIPESQLPFSVKSSEIISLGDVTVTGGTVNLAVHSSGVNKVRVNGAIVQRTFPNSFPFTPLSFGSVKVLRGYAINNAAPFYMVEGDELDEYEEPEIPEGALEIFKITLNPFGSSVDETVVGFREKVIDNWNGVYVHSGDAVLIISNYGLRYSLFGNTGIRIGGFYNYRTEPLYNGIPLSIKNDTGDDIEFFNLADTSLNFIPINPADLPFSIKDGETANFAWNPANGFEIIKTGTTPDLSGYATTPQLDAEITERALQDNNINLARIQGDLNLQGQITNLAINQIEITATTSITNNTVGTGVDEGEEQHMRTVLVKNGVNAINITLETTSPAKFEAIYYKKGSAAITFVAGAGATLVKVANDGILNGAVDSNALVYRDSDTFYLYISNY